MGNECQCTAIVFTTTHLNALDSNEYFVARLLGLGPSFPELLAHNMYNNSGSVGPH